MNDEEIAKRPCECGHPIGLHGTYGGCEYVEGEGEIGNKRGFCKCKLNAEDIVIERIKEVRQNEREKLEELAIAGVRKEAAQIRDVAKSVAGCLYCKIKSR